MGSIKYSKYLQETSKDYRYVDFNRLNPRGEKGRRRAIEYSFQDVITILKPYLQIRFNDQLRVVVPIALYLFFFQIVLFKQMVGGAVAIAFGLLGVILGLMFFMEGLKVGLMPFGENIGCLLPVKAKKARVFAIAFILGVGATFAEPAIGVLKEAGKIVDSSQNPLLYGMLNRYSGYTVIAVAMGVGMATLLGISMFVYGWSLKTLIYLTVIPTLIMTAYAATDPQLSGVIGLAWDCGGVTTGPVTVPLVLSLGVGVAGVIKHKHTRAIPGFGIVTLASVLPVLAVLSLALVLKSVVPTEELRAAAGATAAPEGMGSLAGQSVLLAVRAVVPLAVFLFCVQRWILNEPVQHAGIILYGIVLCLAGMAIFNLGLSFGLTPLGNQVGSIVPAAYSFIDKVANSPLYHGSIGLILCLVFAFLLGYIVTLAEPALNALGITVENLTNGAFRKKLVLVTVSIGVSLGIAVGVAKIVFDVPLDQMLIPLYLLALLLTVFSDDRYVNMGWDSAGVTTGPITVPLVLAMGLGFARAAHLMDGFGILALASVFPILTFLCVGLYLRHVEKKDLEGSNNA